MVTCPHELGHKIKAMGVSQQSREVGNIGVDQSELLHQGHIPKHLYTPGRLYFMIV